MLSLRLYAGLAFAAAVMWAILFTAAGRIDVWQLWAYVGVMIGSATAIYTSLGLASPGCWPSACARRAIVTAPRAGWWPSDSASRWSAGRC